MEEVIGSLQMIIDKKFFKAYKNPLESIIVRLQILVECLPDALNFSRRERLEQRRQEKEDLLLYKRGLLNVIENEFKREKEIEETS